MTTKDDASEKKLVQVTIPSPGDGAYHVQLIGENSANVASAFLTGANDSATLMLQPGVYTANVKPLDEAQPSVQKITVLPEKLLIEWDLTANLATFDTFKALRSRSPLRDPAPPLHTASASSDAVRDARQFTVGISATSE